MTQLQPEVIIEQGKLRGSVAKDIRGKTFFKFQGIPYAKPPLEDLRFKAPQPPEKWSEIFDATKEGDICISSDPLKLGVIAGSEDCLVLNVYTKRLTKDDKTLSPVLFWIHGGGLMWGSGNEEFYGPDFLITEDVVVVTINYRLGLLGLVSFDDPVLDIPGNATFKDQVMALRWVQKNIREFGGDPSNVTIFGESAGAASVHLLMLSPMAKGLFHKAIAQSGCALNPWVEGTSGSKSLAKVMNLEGKDEKTIYEALMEKSAEKLLEIQNKLIPDWRSNHRRALGVVLEKNSKEPFLSEEPLKIISSGNFNRVPFMIGYTTSEGMFSEILRNPDQPDILQFEHSVPWFFGYEDGTTEINQVAQELKNFYFGDKEYSPETITKKFDLISDCEFIYGIYTTIVDQWHMSEAPTYLYRLSIDTELNFSKKFLKLEYPGVSHLDDIGYLFKNFLTPEIKPGSIEDVSLTKIVKLWTNFAKFGNPTPEPNDLGTIWKPVTGPDFDFLDIGKELVPLTNPESERINFWVKLFSESPAAQKSTPTE